VLGIEKKFVIVIDGYDEDPPFRREYDYIVGGVDYT
jgi:hypothetical protein